MNTTTMLLVAASFGAGYFLATKDKPAAVGESWRCKNNPNLPGCKGGQIHTLILPATKIFKNNTNPIPGRYGI